MLPLSGVGAAAAAAAAAAGFGDVTLHVHVTSVGDSADAIAEAASRCATSFQTLGSGLKKSGTAVSLSYCEAESLLLTNALEYLKFTAASRFTEIRCFAAAA